MNIVRLFITGLMIWCSGFYIQEVAPIDPEMAPVMPMPGSMPVEKEQATDSAPKTWERSDAFDNVADEGRGDWFKKRELLNKGRHLLQEERDHVKHIDELKKKLAAEFEAALEHMKKAFAELKFTEEGIIATNNSLQDEIKRVSEQKDLRSEDRQILLQAHDSKKMLDTLHENFTTLNALQHGCTEALSVMITQADQCKTYEQKAWQLYESIDESLSDKVAEHLFAEMQTVSENIQLIDTYLQGDITLYVKDVSQRFDALYGQIREEYVALQDRGVFPKPEEIVSEKKVVETKVVVPESSWWRTLLSPFIWLWNLIVGWFV